MRTFLIVDRLLTNDMKSKNYVEEFFRKEPEIFESDYVLRPEITKLMLGNLDKGEEIFRSERL